MDNQVDQLRRQFEQATRRLRHRLAGITDEEYRWEPFEGTWNVRRREDALGDRPEGRGVWAFDNAAESPAPAPFTTIAWRLMHLTDVIGGYHSFLFGDGDLEDHWLEVPPDAAAGVAAWELHATAFAQALAGDDDGALQRPVRIPWWPAEAPRWLVVANVVTEATHHGAEIGVVRDMHLRRATWRG